MKSKSIEEFLVYLFVIIIICLFISSIFYGVEDGNSQFDKCKSVCTNLNLEFHGINGKGDKCYCLASEGYLEEYLIPQ